MGILNGIATLLSLIVFIGIVWWAFSSKQKKANQEASELPFDLPDEAVEAKEMEKKQHDEKG